MGQGPGKYGHELHEAVVASRGKTVLLLVIGGHSGNGFSFASTSGPEDLVRVPGILRHIAKGIEADLNKAGYPSAGFEVPNEVAP